MDGKTDFKIILLFVGAVDSISSFLLLLWVKQKYVAPLDWLFYSQEELCQSLWINSVS